MAINRIGTQFSNPPAGDSSHLSDILWAMSRTVRDALDEYSIITVHEKLPERLDEIFPEWLCYLDEEGFDMTTFATSQGSRMGTVAYMPNRIYMYNIEGMLAVGNREEELPNLQTASIDWGELLDLAFLNNLTLDGTVRESWPQKARWGHVEWSEDTTYFGWFIKIKVKAQKNRRMQG